MKIVETWKRMTVLSVFIASGCAPDGHVPSHAQSAACRQQVQTGEICGLNEMMSNATERVDDENIENIRSEIARIPRIFMGEESGEGDYIRAICRRIVEVADADTRHRLFNELLDVSFAVELDKVWGPDVNTEENERKNYRNLGLIHALLERLVDEIQQQLMVRSAPPREQFEPMFRYYEKMRDESKRTGHNERGYPGKLKNIERMYGCALRMKTIPDEDFDWVRAKFLELAGRPIRTLEQADADTRAEWERQKRDRKAAQKNGVARPAK